MKRRWRGSTQHAGCEMYETGLALPLTQALTDFLLIQAQALQVSQLLIQCSAVFASLSLRRTQVVKQYLMTYLHCSCHLFAPTRAH